MSASSPGRLRAFWRRVRPKAVHFSFAGAVFALFTGTLLVLAFKFPQYRGTWLGFIVFLVINVLFFVRFREARQKSLWDRMMASKFFPRKLSLTDEGKFLVIISLGMGFAAVNTGSNLLYLLLAMLLSIITASGILSELSVRKVSWQVDFPRHAVARTETLFPIRATNGKRAFNSFSLDGTIQFAEEGQVAQVNPSLLRLPPGQTDYIFPALTFPHRGRYQVNAFALGTRYPFSFFRKSRLFQVDHEVLVVPQGDRDVEEIFFAVATGFEEHAARVGRGSEFYSVRPMVAGDEWRNVHWKQSARLGRFTVKEYEALTARRIFVRLVRVGGSGPLDRDSGEEAIELAASLVKRLAMAGYDVGFQSASVQVPPAAGPGAVRHIFTRLALLDLAAEEEALGPPPHSIRDLYLQVDLDTREVRLEGEGFSRVAQAGGQA
jgi:uncharacterized protein (DUF58 family)